MTQSSQTTDVAPGGLTAPSDGVIVRWRMRTGTTSADITQIKIGLRLFKGDTRGASGGLFMFPLNEPGIHNYDTRLPIRAGDRLGLETYTTSNDTFGGDVPATYSGPNRGSLDEYTSATENGPPNNPLSDHELLLQAEIEPDADHDGFGDETQDFCPTNAGTQSPCAKRANPRATVSYANVQDLIKHRTVKVRLTSNESGTGFANGKLKAAGGHRVFTLISTEVPVVAGKPATLRLRLSKRVLKTTKQALRKHKRVRANVTAFAKNAADDVSAISQLTVRARPPDQGRSG